MLNRIHKSKYAKGFNFSTRKSPNFQKKATLRRLTSINLSIEQIF